jgi:hypothetical protein
MTGQAGRNHPPAELVGFAQPEWFWRSEGTFIGAVFEAPAFVVGLNDLAVMDQPIEHGGGHFSVAEDLRPIGEGEFVVMTIEV